MKALADYVHSKGLKLGIYSSPGPKTCAGYEGSYQHEEQDAKTYAAWGIDYLKYDWCSASQVYANDDQATMAAAYAKMGDRPAELRPPHRLQPVPVRQRWTSASGARAWAAISGAPPATFSDNWDSMWHIGFDLQPGREKFAGPGTGTTPTCWKSATAA